MKLLLRGYSPPLLHLIARENPRQGILNGKRNGFDAISSIVQAVFKALPETLGITSQEGTVNEHTNATSNAGADNQADEEQEPTDKDFSEFGSILCLCNRACVSSEVGGIVLAALLATICLVFLNLPVTDHPPIPCHWETTSRLWLHS